MRTFKHARLLRIRWFRPPLWKPSGVRLLCSFAWKRGHLVSVLLCEFTLTLGTTLCDGDAFINTCEPHSHVWHASLRDNNGRSLFFWQKIKKQPSFPQLNSTPLLTDVTSVDISWCQFISLMLFCSFWSLWMVRNNTDYNDNYNPRAFECAGAACVLLGIGIFSWRRKKQDIFA